MTHKALIATCLIMIWILTGLGPLAWGVKAQDSAHVHIDPPTIAAESAFAFDYDTGHILIDQQADEVRPIASMTKMLSAYIILEAIEAGELSWEDEVMASHHAAVISQTPGLSNVPLIEGETYRVKELMEALAIFSANSATIALAEHYAGTEANFVQLMTDQLHAWGIEDYKLINSSGLNNGWIPQDYWYPDSVLEDENYMSARAISQVAYHLITDYPIYLEFASIPQKYFRQGQAEETLMINYNGMLPGLDYYRPGVSGIKTGTTRASGACLAFSAAQDGRRIVGVVMAAGDGIDNKSQRYEATNQVLDYGFDYFTNQTVSLDQIVDQPALAVRYGDQEDLAVYSDDAYVLTLPVDLDPATLDYQVDLHPNHSDQVLAPIHLGESLGYVHLPTLPSFYQDEHVVSYELKAAEDISELSPLEKIGQTTSRLIQGIYSRAFHCLQSLLSA